MLLIKITANTSVQSPTLTTLVWTRNSQCFPPWRSHNPVHISKSPITPVVSSPPSFARTRKRDVWVRGSVATAKRGKTPVCLCLIVLKRARDLRADYQVYQCKSEATSQFLLTIRRLPLYFEVKQFASLSSVSCWINSSPGLSSCISLG